MTKISMRGGVFYAARSEKDAMLYWPAGPCVSHQMRTMQKLIPNHKRRYSLGVYTIPNESFPNTVRKEQISYATNELPSMLGSVPLCCVLCSHKNQEFTHIIKNGTLCTWGIHSKINMEKYV